MTEGLNRTQKIVMAVSFIALFLFSALRWNVGTDTWHTYTPEYLAMKAQSAELTPEETRIMDACYRLLARNDKGYSRENAETLLHDDAMNFFSGWSNHTAIGFRTLEKLLISIGADVQWLYAVTSAFILFFVFATIKRQSAAPVLALAMFVLTGNFFLSLNIVSQFMAISVCLYACTFAQEKKIIPFFGLIAFGACFHASALIFIPVYFLPRLRVKPVWCAALVAAALIVSRYCFQLIEKIVASVIPAYARYYGVGAEFEWIFFAIGLAVFAVGTYYYPKGKDKPYYRLWYYANILGLLALCFSGHIPFMKRINYYFAAPHFLFLPLVIQCEEKALWRKIMTVTMIVLFVAETVVATGMLNKNGILPYQTFFQYSRPVITESMLEHIPGLW